MKIKTQYCHIEIEWLFVFFIAISFFIPTIQKLMTSFFVCYLFILFHECSHLFVGIILGKNIKKLKLSLSGVSLTFEKDKYEKSLVKKNEIKEILTYIAGPLSNIILAALFYRVEMIFYINLFLAIVNLIPIYPLDGYNIILNYFSLKKKVNIFKKLKRIEIICSFILILICILQILILKYFSTLIFVIYLYLINYENKRSFNIDKILQKSYY